MISTDRLTPGQLAAAEAYLAGLTLARPVSVRPQTITFTAPTMQERAIFNELERIVDQRRPCDG